MENKTIKVVVRFTDQQLQLLESLREQREFGESYENIVVNVFREYIRYINMFPEYIRRKFGQPNI